MWIFAIFVSLTFVTKTLAGEVCCERIGCFNIDKEHPMSHLPHPQCPEKVGLKYYLKTRETIDETILISHDNIPEAYDPSKLTIFTSHGWMGESDMDWMNDMVEGVLNAFDANVIAADWKKGSHKLYYPKAAANTLTVGADIAYLMNALVQDHGDDFNNMWCIGFSLGAHVCGHAGMGVNGQLKRVTGLDPAGPSFSGRNILNGINPTAGQFVDVIHTDGGGIISYYGLIEPRGHADFYPNGGRDQPGCMFGRKRRDISSDQIPGGIEEEIVPYPNPFIGCDHYRGVFYFLDALEYEDCHIARHKCTDTGKKMLQNSCDVLDEPNHMGPKADPARHGLFYVETKSKSPYCKY